MGWKRMADEMPPNNKPVLCLAMDSSNNKYATIATYVSDDRPSAAFYLPNGRRIALTENHFLYWAEIPDHSDIGVNDEDGSL